MLEVCKLNCVHIERHFACHSQQLPPTVPSQVNGSCQGLCQTLIDGRHSLQPYALGPLALSHSSKTSHSKP